MAPVTTAQPQIAVSISSVPLLVGRHPEAGLRLEHATVSRRHAMLRSVPEGWFVEDLESTYGTFVNSARIRKVRVSPGDRIRFGRGEEFRFGSQGQLERELAPGGMHLEVCDVTVARRGRVLLRDVTFAVQPDQYVGILGPSGAGKSTLLKSLAAYLAPQHGTIRFDEHEVFAHPDTYRDQLGFVPQEDVLYPTLTVHEHLRFAARLRLGSGNAGSEVNGAVQDALEQVGLTANAEQPVQQLSGGERKRLNVAIELLRRPRLLLLDEPTAGLDPATEYRLMDELRRIARRGTTVFCTTHVMNSIERFDSLLVLGRSLAAEEPPRQPAGTLVFSGRPDELLDHFGCRGFGDLYEKLASGDLGTSGNGESQPLRERPHTSLRFEPNSGGSRRQFQRLVQNLPSQPRTGQLPLLIHRDLQLVLRDRPLVVLGLAQPLVLGALVCLSQASAARAAPLLFLLLVVAIWLGMNNVARELVRERRQYIRDRLAGLRPELYLASKWLVHTLLGTGQICALLLVLALTRAQLPEGGLTDELGRLSLAWYFCVLLGVYTGALGLGLLVSAVVRTEEAAVACLPLLIMPYLLVSAVGTGQTESTFYSQQAAVPFRPLVAKLHADQSLTPIDGTLDVLSLGLLTRPAILLVTKPTVAREYGAGAWIADLCHLVVLVAASWTASAWVFHRAERGWPRLIGLA